MPRYPLSEPAEKILAALGEALDLVDFGIILLTADLQTRFVNRRIDEIWTIRPDLLATAPSFRQLLESAASVGLFDVPADDLAAYLDEREAEVRAGSTPERLLPLADRRQILFRCQACPDGGRILTYADMSGVLEQKASETAAQMNAELRFNSELLEEQGAHLASLAEAAEENAQRADAARVLLEHEVEERRQLEIKLRQLATTDGLTGALNRAEFLARAQRELEARRGSAGVMDVLMIDVDHFKSINDRFGHAGGDRALQHMVATLGTALRQVDLLGRLGGEEFAVVLFDLPDSIAEVVAERLRSRVADTPTMFGDRPIQMTISLGLATQVESDRSIEQIIARADAALYQAKGSGRNRVVTDRRSEAA
jgi:diguanylate cyclase (GGDEF)-like protein